MNIKNIFKAFILCICADKQLLYFLGVKHLPQIRELQGQWEKSPGPNFHTLHHQNLYDSSFSKCNNYFLSVNICLNSLRNILLCHSQILPLNKPSDDRYVEGKASPMVTQGPFISEWKRNT